MDEELLPLPPLHLIPYWDEEQQEEYICVSYVRGVTEILKSLYKFAIATSNTHDMNMGAATWVPEISNTTLEEANKFIKALEDILDSYGRMKGPGSLEDKSRQSRIPIPQLDWQLHVNNRLELEKYTTVEATKKHYDIVTAKAQSMAQWIRGAMVLYEAQVYLAGDEWSEQVESNLPITKQDLISALQYCIWTFLGQGKMVMFIAPGGVPQLPSTKMNKPSLSHLLSAWINGERLGELMEYSPFAPGPRRER